MEVIYLEEALADLEFWKLSGNKKVMEKISILVQELQVSPFTGTGKPELLKYDLSGKWSWRISQEHRLVYRVTETQILIYSLKGHY